MFERFEDYLVKTEAEGFTLVQQIGLVAIVEHPKGKSRTLYLAECDGELYVTRVRSGRHEIPGANHL